MELCLVLHDSLDGRGVWGRVDTCRCMAESLYCPPETIPTVLIGYTPIQKRKKRIGFQEKINFVRGWLQSQMTVELTKDSFGYESKASILRFETQPVLHRVLYLILSKGSFFFFMNFRHEKMNSEILHAV